MPNQNRTGHEGKRFVESKAETSTRHSVRHKAHDKYFRVLTELVADGEELRDLSLKHGLAVPYNGGTKTKDWCAEGRKTNRSGIIFCSDGRVVWSEIISAKNWMTPVMFRTVIF